MKQILIPGKIAFTLLLLIVGSMCSKGSNPREAQTEYSALQSQLEDSDSLVQESYLLSSEIKKIISKVKEIGLDSLDNHNPQFWTTLDSVSLSLSTKLFMVTDHNKIISTINEFLFTKQKLAFLRDRNDIRGLFPSFFDSTKAGSCVGLSLYYLMIAEKIGLPIHGVLVPGHFFVRYEQDTIKVNIETIKQGSIMSDEWYFEKYGKVDSSSYMYRSLTNKEIVSVVKYNVGTIASSRNKIGDAIIFYKEAVEMMPQFAEAWGNLGIAYDQIGKTEKALDALLEAKKIRPNLSGIDRNLGALYLKRGDYKKALQSYDLALNSDRYNPEILYGRAAAYFFLKELNSARNDLKAALAVKPDYSAAQQLLSQIPSL